MKYHGNPDYRHGQRQRVGILLANLGTPQSPTPEALKPYLKQFLSDPRVVETPRLIWWFILNFVVLTRRPKSSAKAYKQIWTDSGSPLLVNSERQKELVAQYYNQRHQEKVVVELAMSYGQPSIEAALKSFQQKNVQAIIVLPLYPQYSAATSASIFDAISKQLQTFRRVPAIHFIDSYYDEPRYSQAIANSITSYQAQHGKADLILFSYHGLPKRYIESGDPYYCHCHKTTRLVAEKLNLANEDYLMTFQSRFGKELWIKPYTDIELENFPKKGIKNIQIITPGFSSDCVETLEEIDIQNKALFLEAGGEKFSYIPCLNDSAEHIDMITTLIDRYLDVVIKTPRFNLNESERQLSKTIKENVSV